MSKRAKQKRISPHRRRDIDPLGGLRLISNIQRAAQPLDDSQTTDIGLAHWLAFDQLCKAVDPRGDDWGMVTGALNTALLLAEDGYGIEHEDIFIRALDATARAYLRQQQTGKYRLDGTGINDIRTALELHDQQLKLAPVADISKALSAVEDRIKSGNVYTIERAA
jgi:hypothetical protein